MERVAEMHRSRAHNQPTFQHSGSNNQPPTWPTYHYHEAYHFMNAQHMHGAAENKLHSHTHSYTGHTASVGFTLSENNKLSTYVRNVHTRKTKSNQNLNTDILKKLKRKASRTKAIQSSETATSQQLQYAQRVKAVKRKIMAMSNIIIPVSGICLLTQICWTCFDWCDQICQVTVGIQQLIFH